MSLFHLMVPTGEKLVAEARDVMVVAGGPNVRLTVAAGKAIAFDAADGQRLR